MITARPKRIHIQRTKGWRLKDESTNYVFVNYVSVVGRSKFDNPFTIDWVRLGEDPRCPSSDDEAQIAGVATFRKWLTDDAHGAYYDQIRTLRERRAWILSHLHELKGKDLVCSCRQVGLEGKPLPCHADVLLELANG